MPDLLLEVGCEEIPARFVPEALAQMEGLAKEIFTREKIEYQGFKAIGTPRRLALAGKDVTVGQASKIIEKWGPYVNQAYDANGKPTRAAWGFSKSVGVDLMDLEKKDSEKGPRLYYRLEQQGKETREILKNILPELILTIRFPKSMRWGSGKIRFARPIHWIVAVFGGEVVDFELDGIRSGNKTYGHRFLAPGALAVENFNQYLSALEKAYVIVDPPERQKMIENGIKQKASESAAMIYPDPELLQEVNYLVEYPAVMAGEFDRKFLEIPPEVLIAAMRGHQRYFALKEKGTGLKLTSHFIFVANTKVQDEQVVIRGNQKVLAARLNDAEFFYREDLKTPLSKRADKLDQMVFQAGLGTYLDKAGRLDQLVDELLGQICPKDKEIKKAAKSAVKLCKADLLTQMVGEFPELEGIMAGDYAKVQGEPELVWKAIREHYLPKTAGDIDQGNYPQNLAGQILSIADKLDSIIAGFVSGNQPTGSQDPFGIRRLANGIICTALHFGLDFNLTGMIESGITLFSNMVKAKDKKLPATMLDYFLARLKNILDEKNIEYDISNAVIAAWDGSLVSVMNRARALSELRKEPGFEDLFVGFRRVARIIEETGKMDEKLFEQEEEKDLWQAFVSVKGRVEKLISEKQWKEAMRALGELKPFIDRFFDKVMVNVDNKKIRINRHSLLENIAKEFRAIADFSQLTGTEKNP
jgi:glycyl-tRNA synthetase beta chain